MICLTSAEVLNLVARLDSAVLSLDFEQINIFLTKTSGFDTVSILFDSLSVGRRSPEFLVFDLGVPSSDLEWIYIWFMALVPLALDIFRLWFARFQQKAL